jgi:hypothetical protein
VKLVLVSANLGFLNFFLTSPMNFSPGCCGGLLLIKNLEIIPFQNGNGNGCFLKKKPTELFAGGSAAANYYLVKIHETRIFPDGNGNACPGMRLHQELLRPDQRVRFY